jgi:hypothetical protein
VTISATNKLGKGPPSNPFMIGIIIECRYMYIYRILCADSHFAECTNNFVRTEYTEFASESAISCIFLNPLDTSEKTCCVTHGRCDKNGPKRVQKCRIDPPYNIPLEISDHSIQRYCYTVTASNDSHTVKVEGAFTLGNDKNCVMILKVHKKYQLLTNR